ncbi:hypothetical protein ACQ4M4_22580 [Leptolyngbya sp. AN02str]|uniref:hypothetical protein n=1 Tax=Leptolyngbya sp. AN02str TaxID=3423363 RepID=UPI003D310B95
METFIVIGGLILLAITSFYAWFSYRILKEIRQENSLYRNLIERQLRAASQPHLYCDMQSISGQGSKLEIYNIGSVPTYDLHVNMIGAYTEETIDIPTFLRTFVQPRFRKYPLQADKVGYFGVRSSAHHALLSPQKRLDIALMLPTNPVDIYALVQYRDVSSNNYFQVYCFSDIDEKGIYRANLSEPNKPEILERLHFYDMDDAKITNPEKPLPFALRDFVELWNHSLSYQLMSLYSNEVNLVQEPQDA